MKYSRIILPTLCFFCSCGGGGSGGSESAVEGTWSGKELNGVVVCEDGSGTGIGAGTVVADHELRITGTDVLGSVVEVIDGNCNLQGKRTADGFTVTPTSGCVVGLRSFTFVIVDSSTAAVSWNYDLQVAPGHAACTESDDGSLSR